jgi:uncharacterized membrane protein HdeD (DUF308 family)
MTQTLPAPTSSTGTNRSRLRTLHLVRAAVSLTWVALVLSTARSLVSPDTPTVVAAVLLVAYPLWDGVATLLEHGGAPDRVATATVALDLVAAVAMAVAVVSTVGSTLLVFGTWALLSGVLQLVVAVRRRHTLGGQWPMLVSGGLSVLAGAAFAAMSGSATSGLSGVAGYSAFGAWWFLVSAVALHRGARRAR